MTRRAWMLVLVLALVAAACGSDEAADDGGSATDTTVAATTTTTAPATTTTAAPTTTTTVAEAGGIVPGEDAEVDAIVLAYTIALDSVSTYEEKALYIDDPSGLEDTVAGYVKTGESMGGIGVLPTAVAIDGDTAVVTYDLLFAGNPSYPDQTGDAIKTSEGWKVPRAGFCSLMSLARVGCP